jgi:HEPN superfamily AbiU2-like protein
MTKQLSKLPISEAEYWRMFDSVSSDVDAAIKTNHAYTKIHELAGGDVDIFNKYQRFAHFWNVSSYAFQAAFFVSFGRIFDTRSDVFSIQKLIAATIAHPGLFSKAALRERKRHASQIRDVDPQWLIDFVAQAHEPSSSDLNIFQSALAPHYDKFKNIYKPIRHKYFAHRGTDTRQAIEELFSQTLKSDVEEILRFLHTALKAIWEMAWNGRSLDLDDFSSYQHYVSDLDKDIEDFVHHLS